MSLTNKDIKASRENSQTCSLLRVLLCTYLRFRVWLICTSPIRSRILYSRNGLQRSLRLAAANFSLNVRLNPWATLRVSLRRSFGWRQLQRFPLELTLRTLYMVRFGGYWENT